MPFPPGARRTDPWLIGLDSSVPSGWQSSPSHRSTVSAQAPPRHDAAAVEFFEKKVRPVLVGNCYTCHSADTNSKGGLRTDDRNGLIQGGNSGPAVVPGEPDESLLLLAVRHEQGARRCPRRSSSRPNRSPT